MNNFVEYKVEFASQADADNVFSIPLNTKFGPLTLVGVLVYLSAVGGSPTDVTLDVDLTDGTTTLAAIAAQSIGAAAGQTLLEPTSAVKTDGDHTAPQVASPNYRADNDFNFTGGSFPTVTGTAVLRFAH